MPYWCRFYYFFFFRFTGATVEVEAGGDTVENVPDLEALATIAIAGKCESVYLGSLNTRLHLCSLYSNCILNAKELY